MRLDEPKLALLVKVAGLHYQAPDVLSAFELQTLWVLCERGLEFGPEAETTMDEWSVIMAAYADLEACVTMAAFEADAS